MGARMIKWLIRISGWRGRATNSGRTAGRFGGWGIEAGEIKLELGSGGRMEEIGLERRTGDLIGAHPLESEGHTRREGQIRTDGESFHVGAAAAELRIVESIDDRIGTDVAVADAGISGPVLFERRVTELDADDPGLCRRPRRLRRQKDQPCRHRESESALDCSQLGY